ncbi:Homeobox protein Hox-D11 [Thelohanellus kitauei]|uniref:Homeobox protein Hox-D11 n=1 Tax=Thelohanellus kitauei TaxID=669202 RepID=A0A0C2MYD9_THEKT|nr:Homeobox protein Hox-D11 [Thelohanellus kitauei]
MRISVRNRSLIGHSKPPPLELRLSFPEYTYFIPEYKQREIDDLEPLRLEPLTIELPTEKRLDTSMYKCYYKRKRCPLTDKQLKILEREFALDHYIDQDKMDELTTVLELTDSQVRNWYQNQRKKLKKNKNI